MEFGSMDRRKFLKVLGATLLSAIFASLSTFTHALPNKFVLAVKLGKYPGKIKSFNEIPIRKMGKWLG